MAENNIGCQLYQALQETSDEKAFHLVWTWSPNTICKAILEIPKISGGSTALVLAAQQGSIRVVKILITFSDIDEKDIDGKNALMVACSTYNVDLVDLLLQNYANPTSQSKTGKTMLMHCLSYKSPLYFEQVSRITNLMMKTGCHIDATDKYGLTVLYKAVDFGDRHAVQVFLANGANPNDRCYHSKRGEQPYPQFKIWVTPFVNACWRSLLNSCDTVGIGIVRDLLRHGADRSTAPYGLTQTRLDGILQLDAALDGCGERLAATSLNAFDE